MPSNPRVDDLKLKLQQEVKKAESALKKADCGDGDIRELVHCLQVYQAELEMQNQVLEQSNNDNETLRAYYSSLFDLSPLSCLVLDRRLHIRDSNYAARQALGFEKSNITSSFTLYNFFPVEQTQKLSQVIARVASNTGDSAKTIALSDRDQGRFFRAHIKRINDNSAPEECLLMLLEDVTSEETLSRQRELLLSIVENARDLLFSTSLSGEVRIFSDLALEWFGMDRDTDQSNVLQRLPEKLSQVMEFFVNNEVSERKTIEHSIELESHISNSPMFLTVRCFPLFDQGSLDGAGFIITDNTNRIQREDELRLVLKVFDQGEQAIVVTDEETKIVRVNTAFERITGYSSSEVLGLTPSFLFPEHNGKNLYRDLWTNIRLEGNWEGEIWSKRKDGVEYPEWLSVSSYQGSGDEPTHFIIVFRDISEQKKSEKKIEKLAYYDSLTNCGNRRLLQNTISSLVGRQKHERFTLFFFDLDLFKQVNDAHGHDMGDKLLVAVCSRLKNLIKESDQIFRLGGDEFVILVRSLAHEEIGKTATRLVYSCQNPFYIDNLQLQVTMSLGIVSYPNDGDDFNTLIRHADMAMYEVKENGRSGYQFFDPKLLSLMTRKVQIEQYLRCAVLKDELSVVYMPIVDCETGLINSAELLLRWQSKELGFVGPDEFIPVAEKTSLIHELTDFVVGECIKSILRIREMDKGKALRFALNLSPVDFSDTDYFSRLIDRLIETDVASSIVLEITEHVLVDNVDISIGKLKTAGRHGISISVDDFGTGFSSLSYLTNFPINEIKIDRSFVTNLLEDKKHESVCKAIIALTQAVDCQCVAEGVEDQDQLDWLKQHGCTFTQGYLHGKPMTFEELVQRFLSEGV